MSNFKITKAHIEAYVNNGYTVKMMAEDITRKSGVKCSSATVTHACKTYGINLRNKRNPSHFVLEDLDVANPVPASVSAINDAHGPTGGVIYAQIAEEPTVTL